MIDVLFEQHVVQNTGLAAETIWQAVHETHRLKNRTEGVPFPLVFLVLPLTFHQRTAQALNGKTQPGALYKAFAEDREVTVGIQARMQAMSGRTLHALSIGFDTGLLRLDQDLFRQVLPARQTSPFSHTSSDVRVILGAAKRVGQAIAEMSLVQLSAHLNIRF